MLPRYAQGQELLAVKGYDADWLRAAIVTNRNLRLRRRRPRNSTVSMRGVAVRNVGYFAALNITLGSLPSGGLPALLDKCDTIIK
jgi:hypothetical protein